MPNYSMLVSAALAASIAFPVAAQDAPAQEGMEEAEPQPLAGAPTIAPVTQEQKAMLDGWPVEKRAQYDAWPPVTQTYYWSLSPLRQNLFWRITDNDKVRLSQMTPDEQAASWEAIERSVTEQPVPPETDNNGDPDFPK